MKQDVIKKLALFTKTERRIIDTGHSIVIIVNFFYIYVKYTYKDIIERER